METGYFLIADVLGFSSIVVNSATLEPNGKIKSWLDLVEHAAEDAKLVRTPQLVSDTVFAAGSDDEDGLRQVIGFARYLLENGVPKSLLVRGAISHGPFEWGSLTFGKAVIEAHELEANQDWIGVCCKANMPRVDSVWGPDGLVCYPPPFKRGGIRLHPAVVWKVPAAEELMRASTSAPLVNENEIFEWPWLRRLRNTQHFGEHLRQISGADRDAWCKYSSSLF